MKQINLCLFTALVFLLGFISLIVKLRELQVDDSSQYGYANARQSIRRVQTESCRGRILDRHGRVLAETRRSLAIVCQPSFFQYKTWDETVQQLTQAINDVALVIGRLRKFPKRPSAATLTSHWQFPSPFGAKSPKTNSSRFQSALKNGLVLKWSRRMNASITTAL